MKKILLNDNWNSTGINPLTNETIEFAATVPGSSLNDIVNSSYNDGDIFYRDNSKNYQKYENYNFIYTKKFDVEKTDGNVILAFDRLDTYCDVYLNKTHLSYCDNGHISYRLMLRILLPRKTTKLKFIFIRLLLRQNGNRNWVGHLQQKDCIHAAHSAPTAGTGQNVL